MKKVLSLILSICFIFSLCTINVSAEEAIENNDIVIIIHNKDISEETKEKIIAFYSNPENQENTATTYGLTCTLFGHKLESSTIDTLTHKARSTAPRCLKKTYDYESCTRCDYEVSTLIESTYIYCCA